MKSFKLLVILSVLMIGFFWVIPESFGACTGSGLSWTCTAGSTVANVQSAVNSASDAATISFAAGSYTWNSAINLVEGKGVSLVGAGAGSSNVNIAGGNINGEGLTSDKQYRISGFTFSGAPGGAIFMYIFPSVGHTLTNLRIDHNTFSNIGSGNIAIILGSSSPNSGNIYGVMDHNTFSGTDNFMGVKLLWGPGGSLGDSTSWATGTMGSANAFFIEDNVWNFTNNSDLGSGGVDAWCASSIVFRYNTMTNTRYVDHSLCHGGPKSAEVYGNTIVSPTGAAANYRNIHFQGGGEIIAFNNTLGGTSSSPGIALQHFRGTQEPGEGFCGTNYCTGSSSIDLNRPGQSGYPCWHQPGRDGARNLKPIYLWNNKTQSTGNEVNVSNDDDTHVVANRDWYEAVSKNAQTSSTSPFNGTTGMGFGVLANRPTSCTTNPLESGGGVGYFATDQGAQGTLYRCSATNTWTVHYTPYTYPHPLTQGADILSPPSGLRLLQ